MKSYMTDCEEYDKNYLKPLNIMHKLECMQMWAGEVYGSKKSLNLVRHNTKKMNQMGTVVSPPKNSLHTPKKHV